VIPPIRARPSGQPTLDWHQNESNLVISLYTRRPGVNANALVAELDEEGRLRLDLFLEKDVFTVLLDVGPSGSCALAGTRASSSGKLEVILRKRPPSSRITPLKREEVFQRRADAEPRWIPWKLIKRQPVTHDTDLMVLSPPKDSVRFFLRCLF